jgi:ubiquinone biosynthesis protein UbiJ
MIKELSLKTLQKAINTTLALDEGFPQKLQSMHDKKIEIIVLPLNINFFISFSSTGILLSSSSAEPANTVIRSSPLGLIRLSFLPASKVRSLFNDQIMISGDVELGHQVKKLFEEIDIDWEGHLANFTGDVVAHQIGSLLRKGMNITQHLQSSVKQSLSEYLQEELRFFPPREEVEDFFSQIDELALDVERLQAQMEIILRQHHEIH